MAVPAELMTTGFDTTRRTLIVGLGETGLSVARWLLQQGTPVAIVDSREQPPALARLRDGMPADVALFLGGFSADAFAHAEQIVISPGVSRNEPVIAAAIARGVPVTGDIELFAQQALAPVIAVTGSNGKSTVVTLLGAMARHGGFDVRTGGNIGTPALDLLQDNEPDLYVLELSSFQLETVQSLRPRAAVVLNISADHMDRYAGVEEYAAAKQVIYRNTGVQVINRDDPAAAALADSAGAVTGFSRAVPAAGDYGLAADGGVQWLAHGNELLMPVTELAMAGRHNALNALAALALGDAAGLPLPAMLDTLREFGGLPHRMQFVREYHGTRWYNDSKGTNVGATLAAIDGIDAPLVLIAGGDGKGADFTPLAAALGGRARAVILIGQDAERLASVLEDVVRVIRCADLPHAVSEAAGIAEPGDAVLLSPACASTDMFTNYVERGEQFMQAVEALR